jgi:hypothetical protein
MEDWKEISEYPTYEVSSLGRVRNKRGNILAQHLYQGYYKTKLCKDGKASTWYIHRLVAEAFLVNPDKKPTIDHIDRVRTNNSVQNLRWASRYEQSINKELADDHHIHLQENQTYQVRISRTFDTIEEARQYRDACLKLVS